MNNRDFFFTLVNAKRLFPDVDLPEYSTVGSSGCDVKAYIAVYENNLQGDYQSSFVLIYPGETKKIRTGFCVELPKSFEIQIRPRSSMSMKGLVAFGTIDSDYRGEVHIIISNISNTPAKVHHGDRIAQAVLGKVEKIKWKEVDDLSGTERGSGGFGHTGIR